MNFFRRALLRALAPLFLAAMARAEITPARLDQLVITPGISTVLQWTGAPASSSVSYTVFDYNGATYASGQQSSAANGSLSLSLNLPSGYYELSFGGSTQRYGLIAAPLPPTAIDPFFAIDAALSWLQPDASIRSDFLAILQRVHIGMARERLAWDAVNPSSGTYSYQADKNYDTLRTAYVNRGLKILELFYATPSFIGTTAINPFPAELVLAADSCAAMAQHWTSAWGSLEVWNEPDSNSIYYAKDMPADQYAPVAKTFAFSLAAQSPQTLLGGGALSVFNQIYLTQALDNGLLDQTDYLSFHDYSGATSMEGTVSAFRTTLAGRTRAAIPLWITEAGWKWTAGTARPAAAEDAASALQITMKAVESRACGVARFFPFVFPYYVEGANNFGLMGQEGTPLRSMAAYTQAIARLSGATYVGDLQGSPVRTRIFSRGTNGYVLVFYSGVASAGASVQPAQTLSVSSVAGLDGRPLTVGSGGSIPIPDGLTYVTIPAGALLPAAINSSTTAMTLTNLAQQSLPARSTLSPIVLQFPIPANVTAGKAGYQMTAAQMASFPLSFTATNLSSTSRSISLNILANGVTTTRTATIAARGKATITATVAVPAPDGTIRITGSDTGNSVAISPMTLRFFTELNLNEYLALYPSNAPLNITPASQWSPASAGTIALSNGTPTSVLHMDLSFPGGVTDRWAYPQMTLAQPQSPSWIGLQYILIRARAGQSGAVRLFLVEGNGAFYYTANSIIPADGQYHTALIPLSAFSVAGGHPADPNGKLDPGQIVALQIGMNSDTATNTLDVSDYYLITAPVVDMQVEQPTANIIPDGGATSLTAAVGSSTSLNFTIRNVGNTNLTGLVTSKDGTSASEYTITAFPQAPVAGFGGTTTFTVQFTPQAAGTRTAALHITNNDPAKNPYDITLNGTALSWQQDTDGDGLSDAAEFQMKDLGFNWQWQQTALVNTYYATANGAGLYTPAQVQALNIGTPLLSRSPTSGLFKLTIAVRKSTDLIHYNPFPMTAPQTLLNAQGELEFQFSVPDNAAFFRLEAR
jgi:hypothetical protein